MKSGVSSTLKTATALMWEYPFVAPNAYGIAVLPEVVPTNACWEAT